MNIYTEIMKAADSIEAHPELFDFNSVMQPQEDCGTPGCAIGWISYHKKDATTCYGGWRLDSTLDVPDSEFYSRMREFDWRWTVDAKHCAPALRLYAEQYHGHEKPGLPDVIRDIFRQKVPVDPDTCAV